jgi:hypothetical protein
VEVINVCEILVKNTGEETRWVRQQDFRTAFNWALEKRIGVIWFRE